MGRARRLFRARHSKAWRVPSGPPRFDVGTVVYCNYEENWARGVVVAHHYRELEDKNAVHPYQVRLEDGRLIYAPDDDDTCIHRVPRYAVGASVICNVGGGQWEPGRVVAHSYREEGDPHPYPYQILLDNDELIYAPSDDDTFIKTAALKPSLCTADEVKHDPTRANAGTNSEPLTLASENASKNYEQAKMMKNVLKSWRSLRSTTARSGVIDLVDDADSDIKSHSVCTAPYMAQAAANNVHGECKRSRPHHLARAR